MQAGAWPSTTRSEDIFLKVERVTRVSPRDPDPYLVQISRVILLLASSGFLATNTETEDGRRACGSQVRRGAGGQVRSGAGGERVQGSLFRVPVSGAGPTMTLRSNFLQVTLPLTLA